MVFLTQPRKASGERLLLSFDRTTGKQLWQASITYKDEDPTHPTNFYASASPATDGERVVAWFGSAGLVAFDMKGRQLWKSDLGKQRHTWGYASSPVLHGNQVFLNFGPGERSFVVAVDKRTGKTLWQADVPAGKGEKFANWSAEDMYGSWSTPLMVKVQGRDQLIVSHPKRLAAYDPADGQLLWWCEGLGDLVYPSPVLAATGDNEPVILAASGFQGPSMAVKLGGSGDVTASHRLWHQPKSRSLIGTAVVDRGYAYWIDTTGIAQAMKVSNGEVMWTQRLPRQGDDNGVWSSPVLHQGKIYIVNKSGAVVIFEANPERFEAVTTNFVDEPSNSTVVLAGGDLLLRTHQALWCFRP
jgi:outer membrane protein assembly factor BamB